MDSHQQLLSLILRQGLEKRDRTGIGTVSIFGHTMRFDLKNYFPLITTKKIHWKSVVHELLWILSGDTNIQYLQDNGVRIWNEWADDEGELGPVYGKQWRSFGGVDQITEVIQSIKNNPDSRRLIVSAWNPPEIQQMALPPCHTLFQFYVQNDRLSLQLYQRSGDAFLGIPFNIASYSLLTCMVAQVAGLKPGEFIHTIGDAHIYLNHIEQVEEQLRRKPYPFPKLMLNPNIDNIFDFKYEDCQIVDYQYHPSIKAEVAV